MVVQHNLTAMNANRMLGVTTGQQAKSSEKLSSGYKINRAADDAAGLTISEKMRKQIKGLDQASTNAQDGVSAVQTAEGALTEVHSMLQRMNELAVQASNGTNSEADREAIQNEIDQLATEIDRVAETTKFNETYLLKGEAAGGTKTNTIAAHDAGLIGKLGESVNGKTTFTLDKALENGDKVTIAGSEYTIGNTANVDSTEGYETKAKIDAKTMQIGDSVTYADANGKETTYTLTDKVAYDDATYGATTWKAGTTFTITMENGTEVKYTVDGTKSEESTGKILTGADTNALIKEHLDAGHEIKLTKLVDGNGTVNMGSDELTVVSKLETGEVSSAGAASHTVTSFTTATGTADTLKKATLSGEELTATTYTPVSSADIADVVNAMKAGDQLKLNTTTITIADKTDIQKGKYTVEDALAAINNEEGDMDAVVFAIKSTNEAGIKMLREKGITNDPTADNATPTLATANAVTVVGTPTGTKDESVISKETAYKKMAEELAKASSIGTDVAATAVSNGDGSFTITQGTVETKEALTFSLHVGADADTTNKISIDIESMSAAGLGIKGINVKDDSGVAATYAIDAIADAVSKVSAQRSALGAVQNRLEHTIDNLDNVVENTTSAESRIRDTDIAEEMVEYSKNNILAQAGQSMLAQANQSTQGVLSLLQ